MPKKRGDGSAKKLPADKRDAFTRLANARTNKAIHAIGQLQHLANPAAYEYAADEADRIVAALRTAVEDVATRFANPSASKVGSFKL